jgi:hypothetical protein
VWAAAKRAAAGLKLDAPSLYLAPAAWPAALTTLGTDEQPYVVVRTEVADRLTDGELVAAIGHQLGHIQNGHVPYVTALHYVSHAAAMFVRWMVQPATMALRAWARRAEITCDRAALLASRDLTATLGMMVKLELGEGRHRGRPGGLPARAAGDQGPRPVQRAVPEEPALAQADHRRAGLRGRRALRPGHRRGQRRQAVDRRHRSAGRRPPEPVLARPRRAPGSLMLPDLHKQAKAAVLTRYRELADVADAVGMVTLARDIRVNRVPKLEGERFHIVVLGEFNHGKSTFVNALLGLDVLPTGITPTTAAINQVRYGAAPEAKVVLLSGDQVELTPSELREWVTVAGGHAARGGLRRAGVPVRHPARQRRPGRHPPGSTT